MSDPANQFLSFEASLLAERYSQLKERDNQNFIKQTKLFSFLILYGAAPFVIATNAPPAALFRAWGGGGIWLVVAILFICDRGFRAYGLHLKERIYCLYQLSILRGLTLGRNEEYRRRTLLPINGLKTPTLDFRSFPERISPGQIRAACYFYKFIGIFPFLYSAVFIHATFMPADLTGEAHGQILKTVFALAPLLSLWFVLSANRCLALQRNVFEARRIRTENPWPVFHTEQLKNLKRNTAGHRLYNFLVSAMFMVSIICTAIFFLMRIDIFEIQLGTMERSTYIIMTLIWVIYFFYSDDYLTSVLRDMKRAYRERFPDDTTSKEIGDLSNE